MAALGIGRTVKGVVLTSKGDTSLDVPAAAVVIELSALFGSRCQHAQRVGRVQRMAPAKPADAAGFHSHYYSLVAEGTSEVRHAVRRRQFVEASCGIVTVYVTAATVLGSRRRCFDEPAQRAGLAQLLGQVAAQRQRPQAAPPPAAEPEPVARSTRFVLAPRAFSCVCGGGCIGDEFACRCCGTRGHLACYAPRQEPGAECDRLCHSCRATPSSPEFWRISCTCGVEITSDSPAAAEAAAMLDAPMFECEACKRWAHLACYGGEPGLGGRCRHCAACISVDAKVGRKTDN